MEESEELKSLLKVKEESEKVGLKLNIQKAKISARFGSTYTKIGTIQRRLAWPLRKDEKQITSPGWMHETSAQAWCTGKTQRNWVENEVGGGNRDGEYM